MYPPRLASMPVSDGIIRPIPQKPSSSRLPSFSHILNPCATGQTKPILIPLSPRDVVSSLDEGKYKLTLTKNSSSGQIYVQLHKYEEEASPSFRSLPTVFAIPPEKAHLISSSPFFGALINPAGDVFTPIINITKDEEHSNTHDSQPLTLLLHYVDPEYSTFELKPSEFSFYQECFNSTGCYSFISPFFLKEVLSNESISPETKNDYLKLLFSILEVNPKIQVYHAIFSNFCRDYISHNGIEAATTFFSSPERAALCHKVSQLNLSNLRLDSEPASEFLKLFPNLTTLDVSWTGITSLPETLRALTELDISQNGGFNTKSLRFFTALIDLDASDINITSLPETLTALRKLCISGNRGFNEECLEFFTAIESLDASDTGIAYLPETLRALTTLYISYREEIDTESLRFSHVMIIGV
ncbi:MAG: hypothetical protein K9M07_05980 [Simkaniaceae bacterium]|nr:hypothetical protein [Simkaniaceae bacterium]